MPGPKFSATKASVTLALERQHLTFRLQGGVFQIATEVQIGGAWRPLFDAERPLRLGFPFDLRLTFWYEDEATSIGRELKSAGLFYPHGGAHVATPWETVEAHLAPTIRARDRPSRSGFPSSPSTASKGRAEQQPLT